MRNVFGLLLILLCGGLVHAQKKSSSFQPTFTSVYTDMKRDCKTLADKATIQQGSDPPSICKGYGGYRINVGYSAWAAGISVEGIKDPNDQIILGTDYGGYGAKGEKIEWRMANGKPFAVIMRVGKYKERNDGENPYTDANRTGSKLIVKGLKGYERIEFEIDGATPNANQKARDMADQNYSEK